MTETVWTPGTRVRVTEPGRRGRKITGIVLEPDDPAIDPHLRATAQASGRSAGQDWNVPVRIDFDRDDAPMWYDPTEIEAVAL
jgi:hypothetical protein